MAASTAPTMEEELSARVLSLSRQELDDGLRHLLKRNILDSYAGICGSLRDARMLATFDRLADASSGDIAVWGIGRPAALGDAVFANAILGRRSDLLDTYLAPNGMGGAHPSDSVALVLTLADWLGLTGDQVLTTAHVAFWLSATFATYYDPESSGFDHDAVATFSTALTIGQALGCTADELTLAQRIAGMLGLDTNQAALGQVTDWKHCTYASCAVRGLMAVRLARAGFEAPPDIYGGVAGVDRFFRHADALFEPPADLGRIVFKRWPALVFCQTPIDVALSLADRVTDPAAITDVEVRTYQVAARNGATAAAAHPTSRAGRTHSIPYCVATALLGRVAYEDFDKPCSSDPTLQSLMGKVRVVVDDEMDAGYPQGAPCAITVTLSDGATVEARRDRPVGDPGDPLTDAQLEAKLRQQLFFVDEQEQDVVIACLQTLEARPDVQPLLAPLRRRLV
ncbi:MAG: MmgE/PrpD family protein [Candidatus Nanopelagicales bacterium]